MARSAAALFLSFVLLASGANAEPNDAGLYLYKIPSSRIPVTIGDGGPVLLDLFVAKPLGLSKHLAEHSTLTVVDAAADRVRVSVGDLETLAGVPGAEHSAYSFVIDYDEPAVANLSAALDEDPSIAELTDFVFEAVGNKSYRRSFDLASQVAANGEGDCTEHAVLLTALARAAGKPARVVLGVVSLAHNEELTSFGHAWTEIYDAGKWHVADATKPRMLAPDAEVRYLPIMELSNEGPGYAFDLVQLAVLKPLRIEWVAPPA